MKLSKNQLILVAIVAAVVIALGVTLVLVLGNNGAPAGTTEVPQTTAPVVTQPATVQPTEPAVQPTEPKVETYTVTFKDHDGTVLKTETVEEGKAATAPAAPTREGYTFKGWDKAYHSVTADLVVTATYQEVPVAVTYTVTFKDYDGTVLKTETVEEGKAATAPAAPTRAGYTFEGWDKAFDKVTANLEITANYKAISPVVVTYTVTFKDHDGKVLKTQMVEKGKAATAPANPSREGYTFEGWDKAFNKVTSDLVVTATYKALPPVVVTYTVVFKDYNGAVLKTQTVEEGKAATAPAAPSRAGYTFEGWDKAFNKVTSNLVVTATYKAVPPAVVTYTVTFKDHDGKVLKTQTVEKGKGATAPANPSREGYTFEGWDKAFNKVTSNLVVTATYKAVPPAVVIYVVTFKDHDGKVLKTQTVEKGKGATAPANPSREGYTFEGWDKAFNNVTSDLVVTATYKAIATYTVTFKDHDGKVLKTQTVQEGKAATAPADPSREHFSFAGWDKSFTGITSDLVVTATYTTAKIVLSVESVTVNKGTKEVTVNVRVYNNPGIMGAVLKLSVDDGVFSFRSGSKNAYPGLTLTSPGSGVTASPYTFMLDALELSQEDRKDGTLFSVTFTIDTPDATGTYDVELSYNNKGIFDENYNYPAVVLENGTITIQ